MDIKSPHQALEKDKKPMYTLLITLHKVNRLLGKDQEDQVSLREMKY